MNPLLEPSASTLLLLVAASLIFVLAGLVKGVIGLGLPTVSVALLALMMSPARAAVLLIVPSLMTNIWQIRPWSALGPMLRRLATMQVGVVVGTLTGAAVFGPPSGHVAAAMLGFALIVYALWGLAGFRWSVSPATERWLGPVCGVVTGLVAAATGVFVIPAVAYLQGLGLARDALIQAMGISFTVSTLALAVGLSLQSQYSGPLLLASLLMLLPAVLGMWIGERLRRRLSPEIFRRVLFVGLALLGAHMVARETGLFR